MGLDKSAIKERSRRILDPAVTLLASMGVPPILVSVLGLAGSFCAAYVIARGSLFWGGVWALAAGLCDVLDGSLARRLGRETEFGAFIDSTFDRVSEFVIYGAIVFHFARAGYSSLLLAIVWVAMGGSFLVSYARARIEGLGHRCTVGLLERPERLALLIAGLVFGHTVLVAALVVIAVGTVITVLQRIHHAYKVTHRGP
jgi:phosphatidylglycerophosphate synthase